MAIAYLKFCWFLVVYLKLLYLKVKKRQVTSDRDHTFWAWTTHGSTQAPIQLDDNKLV